MPDPSLRWRPPSKRENSGAKGTRPGGTSVAVGVYLVSVSVAPAAVYWCVTNAQDWGEFWRIAAGPTGTMLAAAGAVFAAYLALFNGERTRRQERDLTDRDRRVATERDLRARFTSAAEQLGDRRLNVRQAGAYVMAGVADDWLSLAGEEPAGPKEAQVCIDVLCANLRDDSGDDAGAEEPPDQSVRSVIIHIIASHVRAGVEPSWRQHRFDLSGARLHDINLSKCHFQGSLTLSGAQFSGQQAIFSGSRFANATFDGARFWAGTVAEFTDTTWNTTADFKGTTFGGFADFERTHFKAGASFVGASLGTSSAGGGGVSFKHAEFVGVADFSNATVYDSLAFCAATFRGNARFVRMKGAIPQHPASVSFHSATFHGPADFENCAIGDQADFRKSTFLGTARTPVSLDDTDFDSDAAVRFANARFCGSEFGQACFNREVSFYGAEFFFRASFPCAVFAAPVRFENAKFDGGVTFRDAHFTCGADFYRVRFGTDPVDFTDPVVWNDVRVDWDGQSPFPTSIPHQPSNVSPPDWPPRATSQAHTHPS